MYFVIYYTMNKFPQDENTYNIVSRTSKIQRKDVGSIMQTFVLHIACALNSISIMITCFQTKYSLTLTKASDCRGYMHCRRHDRSWNRYRPVVQPFFVFHRIVPDLPAHKGVRRGHQYRFFHSRRPPSSVYVVTRVSSF